jgi:anionic cell wall polymer biosynthesis LytR-Cps2A-Psr (LCP) family protein
MGLITWIVVVVTILAIMGLGWNVFVSGVYKGVHKIMGSTILKKMTEKAQQLVGNITKNGSEEKILKRPTSNSFSSNLNV